MGAFDRLKLVASWPKKEHWQAKTARAWRGKGRPGKNPPLVEGRHEFVSGLSQFLSSPPPLLLPSSPPRRPVPTFPRVRPTRVYLPVDACSQRRTLHTTRGTARQPRIVMGRLSMETGGYGRSATV